MRAARWLCPTVLSLLLLLPGPAPVAAQGSPFTYRCPSGSALVGLDGWHGWWMDGIRGVCAPVTVTSGTIGTTRSYTSVAGTVKGTTLRPRCPSGTVLTGFTGTSGTYVLTIYSIRCSAVLSGGYSATSGTFYNAFPRTSSSGYYLAGDCNSGTVATAINGRAGIYLDYFAVRCELLPGATAPSVARSTGGLRPVGGTVDPTATPATVALRAPSGGLLIHGYQPDNPCADVDLFPAFDWDPAANAASYQLEVRNTTANRTRTVSTTASAGGLSGVMPIAGNGYSWRVRGVNGGLVGPWSGSRGFTAVAATATRTGTCYISGAGAQPF